MLSYFKIDVSSCSDLVAKDFPIIFLVPFVFILLARIAAGRDLQSVPLYGKVVMSFSSLSQDTQ